MPHPHALCEVFDIILFKRAFPARFVWAHYPSYILKITFPGPLLSDLSTQDLCQEERLSSSIKVLSFLEPYP